MIRSRIRSSEICRNIARDELNAQRLDTLAWTVITVWECELGKNTDATIGYILKKFHVKRGDDGLWHITKQYTTAKESTEHLVQEVINYGYWEVPLGNH